MRHPAIGAIAALLANTDEIRLFNSSLVYKAPHATRENEKVGWHTDRAYWGTCTSDKMITAGVPLHDCPEDMGPLIVIDGSHTWPDEGIIAELRRARNFKFVDLASIEEGLASAGHRMKKAPLATKKGQVIFHHCRVFHGSGLNRSDSARRVVVLHLQDRDNRYRRYLDEHGKPYVYNNDLLCRKTNNGAPDYSDPHICPLLYSA